MILEWSLILHDLQNSPCRSLWSQTVHQARLSKHNEEIHMEKAQRVLVVEQQAQHRLVMNRQPAMRVRAQASGRGEQNYMD